LDPASTVKELCEFEAALKETATEGKPLPLFHSTKSEVFLSIFASTDAHTDPTLGLNYPVFTFYGKPAFFCQFSNKLNRMCIGIESEGIGIESFCLHDSGIQFWPIKYKEILDEEFGGKPSTIKGSTKEAARAAEIIFGSREGYFIGQPLDHSGSLHLIQSYVSLVRRALAIDLAQAQKVCTFEFKTGPIVLPPNETVVFVILPGNPTRSTESSAAEQSERDSASALMAAAKTAKDRGYKVVADLYIPARPVSLKAFHEQLFGLVKTQYLGEVEVHP
jgi:hypothetical protein